MSPEIGVELGRVACDVELHTLAWCCCSASRLDAEVWLECLDIPGICHWYLA